MKKIKAILVLSCLFIGTTFLVACVPLDPSNDGWGEWTVVSAPTCTEEGERTRTKGEEVQTEVIPALGHFFSSWATITTATCTEEGSRIRICTRDEFVESEVVPVNETLHKWGTWHDKVRATCSSSGLISRSCLHNPEHVEENEVAQLEHSYQNYTVTKVGSCVTVEETTGTCPNCGDTDVIVGELDPTNHEYVEDWSTTAVATCSQIGSKERNCECGEGHVQEDIPINPNAHNMVFDETITGNCVVKTVTVEKCNREGCRHEVRTEGDFVTDAHDWDTVVTAPTCTEDGYTTKTCKREGCNEEVETEPTTARGHSYTEFVKNIDATNLHGVGVENKCANCTDTKITYGDVRSLIKSLEDANASITALYNSNPLQQTVDAETDSGFYIAVQSGLDACPDYIAINDNVIFNAVGNAVANKEYKISIGLNSFITFNSFVYEGGTLYIATLLLNFAGANTDLDGTITIRIDDGGNGIKYGCGYMPVAELEIAEITAGTSEADKFAEFITVDGKNYFITNSNKGYIEATFADSDVLGLATSTYVFTQKTFKLSGDESQQVAYGSTDLLSISKKNGSNFVAYGLYALGWESNRLSEVMESYKVEIFIIGKGMATIEYVGFHTERVDNPPEIEGFNLTTDFARLDADSIAHYGKYSDGEIIDAELDSGFFTKILSGLKKVDSVVVGDYTLQDTMLMLSVDKNAFMRFNSYRLEANGDFYIATSVLRMEAIDGDPLYITVNGIKLAYSTSLSVGALTIANVTAVKNNAGTYASVDKNGEYNYTFTSDSKRSQLCIEFGNDIDNNAHVYLKWDLLRHSTGVRTISYSFSTMTAKTLKSYVLGWDWPDATLSAPLSQKMDIYVVGVGKISVTFTATYTGAMAEKSISDVLPDAFAALDVATRSDYNQKETSTYNDVEINSGYYTKVLSNVDRVDSLVVNGLVIEADKFYYLSIGKNAFLNIYGFRLVGGDLYISTVILRMEAIDGDPLNITVNGFVYSFPTKLSVGELTVDGYTIKSSVTGLNATLEFVGNVYKLVSESKRALATFTLSDTSIAKGTLSYTKMDRVKKGGDNARVLSYSVSELTGNTINIYALGWDWTDAQLEFPFDYDLSYYVVGHGKVAFKLTAEYKQPVAEGV